MLLVNNKGGMYIGASFIFLMKTVLATAICHFPVFKLSHKGSMFNVILDESPRHQNDTIVELIVLIQVI